MRKVIRLILVAALVCSLFAGCSKPAAPAETQAPASDVETATAAPTEEPVKEDITISYLASQDWVQPAEQELGAQFKEATGITVDYQIVPSDQYFNLLLTKLNSGECTDLFGSQSGKFDIVSQLNIEQNGVDLSGEEWVTRLDPLAAEQLTVNGKLYGMTLADISACWAICYNKSIFDNLSLTVPTTYDAFKQTCQTILDSGVTPIYECVSDGWHHVLWFPELGGRYEEANPGLADQLNNNETKFADNETMLTALTQLKELVDSGYFGENFMSNTYADTEANMAGGQYAMTVYNQGLPGQIEAAFPDVKADTFGFFVIPLADNQILNVNPAGPSLFIYSGSENIDAAKQYLAFIADAANIQYLVDNTPKFNTLPFSGVNNKYSDVIKEFYNSYPTHGTVYQTQIKYLNPQWMEIGKDLSAMFTGAMEPSDVLQSIDNRRADAATAASDPAWAQ